MSSPVEIASPDLYEMFFEWPSTEPYQVIITGTFDKWARTKYLNKTARGFVGTVRVPWGEKIKYKFIVDGKWLTLKGQPTEMDPGGYVNNVFVTPPKPYVEEKPAVVKEAPVEPPVEPAQPEPKEEIAVTSGSEVATVSPPEAVTTATSRIPIVFVPLNSTEHNTIGSSQASPPDYLLPPSPRASAVVAATTATPTIPVPEFHTALSTPVDKSESQDVTPTSRPTGEITTVESENLTKGSKEEGETKSKLEAPAETLDDAKAPKEAETKVEGPEKQEDTQPLSATAPIIAETPEVQDKQGDSPKGVPSQPAPEIPSIAKEASTPTGSPERAAEAAPAALPTPPITPSKKSFLRSRSPSSSSFSFSSPGSPKSGTAISKRKKRTSFIGKIKEFFHHDHDKEKAKETEKGTSN